MKYRHYILKRKIENALLFKFILLGRFLAKLKPLKKEYDNFFFFPFYHTGGAEKVHALISQATGNAHCIIYFTRKSADRNFYNDFEKSGCTIKDISAYTDNKWIYFVNFIYRGLISGYINSQRKKPIVFNGQCNFGYKVSPWINSAIPQVELSHSFNTFSWIRLPFLPFYRQTIMISQQRIKDHLAQYDRLGVPAHFRNKIQYIVNGVPLPMHVTAKEENGNIKVLYVGRGTEEKRVHLVAQIARQAADKKLPVSFLFMGDVAEAIPIDLHRYCTFLGHKSDAAEIDAVYQQAHVVIITSSTEGFPLVIEEGMARGCGVLASPVGDIPYHVKQAINGFLFSVSTDEHIIVNEGITYLSAWCSNRKLLLDMGLRNIEYAKANFSLAAFNRQYNQLFNQLRNQPD